jgi:transposase
VPRTRPPYTPEFRAEAVRLYRTSDRGLKQISAELGIAPESLRRWAQQIDIDAGRAPGLTTEEREELRRLRKENRTLRMERDLLKKATAFFAREGETP